MPAEQGYDNPEARLEIATEHLANNVANRVLPELRAPATYGLGASFDSEPPQGDKDVAYFTAREARPKAPKVRIELPWQDMAMVEAPDAVSKIEADPARLAAILERAGTKLNERAPSLWPRFKDQFEVVLTTKTGERKVDIP